MPALANLPVVIMDYSWLANLSPEILIFGFGGWVLVSLALIISFVTIIRKILVLVTNHMSDVSCNLVSLKEAIEKNSDKLGENSEMVQRMNASLDLILRQKD